MTRRGFVMPIVLVLAITIGLLASVILAQAAQRSAIVRDQLEAYHASHRDRGVKELAAAWLIYSSNQDLRNLVGGDRGGGEAFTVDVGRDAVVSVRIEPAQGTARINPIGLNVSDGRAAREVETILRERFGEAGMRARTRELGPVVVDVTQTPNEVLVALAQAALAGIEPITAEEAGRFVAEVRRRETDAGIDAGDVRAAGEAIGLRENASDRLAALFGSDPTLWRVTAIWEERDPVRPWRDRRDEYTGLIDLSSQARSGFAAQHPRELFLQWELVEPSGTGIDGADGYTDPGARRGGPGA